MLLNSERFFRSLSYSLTVSYFYTDFYLYQNSKRGKRGYYGLLTVHQVQVCCGCAYGGSADLLEAAGTTGRDVFVLSELPGPASLGRFTLVETATSEGSE